MSADYRMRRIRNIIKKICISPSFYTVTDLIMALDAIKAELEIYESEEEKGDGRMNCKKCGYIFCMADHPSGEYECGEEEDMDSAAKHYWEFHYEKNN